jgi:hypothetical protein
MIFGLVLSIFILFEDKSFDNILNSDLSQLNGCSCSCKCDFTIVEKNFEKRMKGLKGYEDETRKLLV